ncbi:MAG: hypothetical protein QG617_245 [Campylobacterota bacterium]|nr:hypothetical protein [Campylobacterota bacterium]
MNDYEKLKYFSPSKVSVIYLKFRRYLGYIASFFLPILGNKILLVFLLNKCVKSNKQFCLNPYLASYFFKKNLLVTLPISCITHFMRDWVIINNSRIHMSDYFIGSGEWDEITTKIEDMPVLKEAFELAENNWDFTKTEVYKQLLKNAKNGAPSRKQHILLDSVDKIDAYFTRYKNLFFSIKENGFKNKLSDSRNIGIAIGKNGSISKLPGGQHRFSIAYILNIPVVEVEIRMIHKEYLQKICREYGLDYIDGVLKIAQILNEKGTHGN